MVTQEVACVCEGNRNNLVLVRKDYNQGSNNVDGLPVALKLWLFFSSRSAQRGGGVGPVRTKAGHQWHTRPSGTSCSPSPTFFYFQGWLATIAKFVGIMCLGRKGAGILPGIPVTVGNSRSFRLPGSRFNSGTCSPRARRSPFAFVHFGLSGMNRTRIITRHPGYFPLANRTSNVAQYLPCRSVRG